jgi:protein-disulfide isomerase
MLGLAMVAVVVVGAGVGLVNTGVIAKETPAPEIIAPARAGSIPDHDSTPKPTQVVQAQLAQGQATQAQVAQAAEKNDPLSERVLGDPNAPVTILEYSSLTCPHCASFHANTLPQLKKDYIDTGKAKLVFRDFPFDRAALQASMLARCSNPERYFGFLDVLFKSQNKWAGASDPAQALAQTGKLAGVGDQQFQACMSNEALANKLIERRLEAEQKYQVQSTPTFVIMRGDTIEKVVGAQPITEFARVIDKLGS